jgi:uncharacterized protein
MHAYPGARPMDHSYAHDDERRPWERDGVVYDRDADSSERTYTTFLHLAGLLSLVDVGVTGLGGLIATLILWMIKKDESAFIDDHGRDAMNFQLSCVLYFWAGTILSLGVLTVPLVIGLVVLRLTGNIRGAMAANRGEYYRYPMTIRFLA